MQVSAQPQRISPIEPVALCSGLNKAMIDRIEMEQPIEAKEKMKAAARIAFVMLCVLIGEWIFPLIFGHRPWAFSFLVLVILIFGFFSHRALHETPSEIGLRLDNFPGAARLLAPPMLLGAVVLLVIGYWIGSLGVVRNSASIFRMRNLIWLFWWGLLQQYVLQAIVNRQAQTLWDKGTRSILVVALMFGLLHLPNFLLVLATFAGGLVWAYTYQKAPNIIALAFSHCIMTLVLIWALSPSLLHNLRVGAGYYSRM
jgi:membrane protease YdiL (CAAX protease family)